MLRWVVAVALAGLVLPMPALAQEGATDAAVIAEDPEGDLSTGAGPAEDLPADPRWQHVDLRRLGLQEHADGFTFTLEVTPVDATTQEIFLFDAVAWQVYFTFKDQAYRAQLVRIPLFPIGSGAGYEAYLQVFDGGTGQWASVTQLTVVADEAAGSFVLDVPRHGVLDSQGAHPTLGTTLDGFYAEASWLFSDAEISINGMASTPVPLSVRDRMPDTGSAAATWQVVHGLAQSGHAWLRSDAPVRLSNGEATTFLMLVEAGNDADFPDTFTLQASDVPPEWVVTFPEETVRLDAEESVQVPILVTTPFNHEHGAFRQFLVEMQSRSDPLSTGRIELGVRYTAIPQPAGHHDTVWFHSGGESGFFSSGWMNALEDDPADADEPVASSSVSCGSSRSTNYWTIDLLPGLGMGLDFDVDRVGEVRATLRSVVPLVDASLTGSLMLLAPDENGFFGGSEEDVVARIDPTAPVTMGPNEEIAFVATLSTTENGDYIPYEADSRLTLRLGVEYGSALFGCINIGTTGPELLPGGSMQMPLDEFHDDVDEYFSALSGVELVAADSQQRLVNPGETTVFRVTARNIGAQAGTFDLDLTGAKTEWARLLGDTRIRLGPQSERTLAVAVSPPSSAGDGELVDVTLHATKADDPNIRSVIRLLAEVDTDEDHADEAADADSADADLRDAATPGPAPWLVVAVLGAAAAVSRRRD